MELVHKDDHVEFFYDEVTDVFASNWLQKDNEYLEEEQEELKEIVLDSIKLRSLYKPKLYLADERNRQFAYTTDMQEWMGEIVAKNYLEIGLKKCAVLLPEDLIASLSTTQSDDETKNYFSDFEIEYFPTTDLALKWLVS